MIDLLPSFTFIPLISLFTELETEKDQERRTARCLTKTRRCTTTDWPGRRSGTSTCTAPTAPPTPTPLSPSWSGRRTPSPWSQGRRTQSNSASWTLQVAAQVKQDHAVILTSHITTLFIGFSEGSYESSPNRSPVNSYENHDKQAQYPSEDQSEEKPLSLVIRKSLVAGDETQAEYTVHSKHGDNYWTGQGPEDSGNEDSEHALVISEDDKDQDLPQDFSNVAAKSRDAEADQESQSNKAPGIKIKSFAKIFDDPTPGPSHEGLSTVDVQESSNGQSSNVKSPENPDNMSDVTSEASADSISEGTPYTYGTEVEMTRVTKTASGESLYQCGFCDKLFANKYHLQSHLVTHTGERAFTCKLCSKNFGRKSTLRAHMTTHTKVSNFMCGVCEKACNDNNSLEEHMRMHTGTFDNK